MTVTLERGADGRLGLNVDRTPGGYPVVVAPVPDGLESGDVVMLIGGRPVPETVTLAEALGPPQPTHEVTVLRLSASTGPPPAANHAMLRGATYAWFAELLVLMAVLRYDAASAALGVPAFGPVAALTEALWSSDSWVATNLALYILGSWATLGQRGRGHVNNHNASYIEARFAEIGFRADTQLRHLLRHGEPGLATPPGPHYRQLQRNIFAFVRDRPLRRGCHVGTGTTEKG